MRFVSKRSARQAWLIAVLVFVNIVLCAFLACGQTVSRPLPKLVQNLSDEDYAIWAQWQNRQAERRAEADARKANWFKYNYANKVVSNNYSRSNATTNTSSSANVISNTTSRGGKGWSNRSGSRSMTRNGHSSMNAARFGGNTVTSYTVRFRNPDYVGPGTTNYYNPWVRHEGGLGTPDWSTIFVPCKEGTVTMQEVLDRLDGPRNPENVFNVMMEGYLGG